MYENIHPKDSLFICDVSAQKINHLFKNKIMCEKIVERGFLEKRIKKDNKTSGRNG